MTDPLEVLLSGARFERKEQQQQAAASAAAAAARAAAAAAAAVAKPLPPLPSSSPAAGSKKKRKRQQEKQAAGAGYSQDDADGGAGIALFGGASGGAALGQQQQQAAAAAEQLPAVQHSNDPHEEANLIRKALRIKVKGSDIPHPLRAWSELEKQPAHPRHHNQQQQQQAPSKKKHRAAAAAAGNDDDDADLAICGRRLLAHLDENGWGTPTPIQRQAVPALLSRREVLAVAPTGSGKTLAFLLPMMALLNQAKQRGGAAWPAAPKALLLSPTHELAGQTARVLKLLLPGSGLRCCLLNKNSAGSSDFSKVDVLIANPLRLKLLAEAGKVDLSHVSYLVLDEADKLLAMGFTEQVDAVLAAASNPRVQRALFSATLPDKVDALARSVLRDPLTIAVGERNSAQSLVSQRLMFVGRGDAGRLLALRQLLSGGGGGLAADGSSVGGLLPPILVFVSSKERAKQLHRDLLYQGVRVDSISGDQPNAVRTAAVDNFRAGKTWVLVATDLIGRGMDFAGVNTVINYDCPATTADYIHRIGRTGRAGHAGQAITFFSEEDAPRLRGIAHLAAQAGSEVPEWMLHLTSQRDRKRAHVGKRLRAAAAAAQQQGQPRRRAGLLDVDSDDDAPPPRAAAGGGGVKKARGGGGKRPKQQQAPAAQKQKKKRDKKQRA